MKNFPVIFFLLAFSTTQAAKVDSVDTYSNAMKKTIKAVVIKPDNYADKAEWPVVYLLHGHGGSYNNWVKNVKYVQQAADQLQMMIVCPYGGVSSWYWDSPEDSAWKYETYVA